METYIQAKGDSKVTFVIDAQEKGIGGYNGTSVPLRIGLGSFCFRSLVVRLRDESKINYCYVHTSSSLLCFSTRFMEREDWKRSTLV